MRKTVSARLYEAQELEEKNEIPRGGITAVNRLRNKSGEWYSTNEEDCIRDECFFCESITLQNDVFTIRFDKSECFYEGETVCFPIGSVERFVL